MFSLILAQKWDTWLHSLFLGPASHLCKHQPFQRTERFPLCTALWSSTCKQKRLRECKRLMDLYLGTQRAVRQAHSPGTGPSALPCPESWPQCPVPQPRTDNPVSPHPASSPSPGRPVSLGLDGPMIPCWYPVNGCVKHVPVLDCTLEGEDCACPAA